MACGCSCPNAAAPSTAYTKTPARFARFLGGLLAVIVLGVVLLVYALARDYNALSLGEEGARPKRIRFKPVLR